MEGEGRLYGRPLFFYKERNEFGIPAMNADSFLGKGRGRGDVELEKLPRFAFDGVGYPYFLFRLYGDFFFCWRRKKEAKTALFGPAHSRKQWPRACSGFRMIFRASEVLPSGARRLI
jgi:hypothetical protein